MVRSNRERIAYTTDYVHSKGDVEKFGSGYWWWLRSSGTFNSYVRRVFYDGSINQVGNYVNLKKVCVRPALWLNL